MNLLGGKTIAIVGAGVSGLAAAHRLRRRGARVTVFEKSAEVGGRTLSLRRDGFTIDLGALMMMPTYRNVIALSRELGIEKHLVATKPIMSIVREGVHHEIDMSRPLRSALHMKLISVPSALKLLKLLPVVARNWSKFHYENMGDLAPFDGESIHEFCAREFNAEIEDYLASPLIRAGSLTSTREAPFGDWLWQTVGFRYPTVLQWDQGMDFFAQSLARGQDIHFDTDVTHVRNEGGKAVLQVTAATGATEATFDACLVAVPVPVARRIAPCLTPQQDAFFGNLRPVPMTSLHLALREAPPSKASIILLPEKESPHVMMILLDHNKVSGRAPAGKGIATIWTTKEWTAAHADASDEFICAELCRLAEPFVGRLDDKIEFSHVQRRDFVVAQTYPGFFTRLRDYMATRDLDQPIFFSGDFSAEGIEGAVTCALNAAGHIERYLMR